MNITWLFERTFPSLESEKFELDAQTDAILVLGGPIACAWEIFHGQ